MLNNNSDTLKYYKKKKKKIGDLKEKSNANQMGFKECQICQTDLISLLLHQAHSVYEFAM